MESSSQSTFEVGQAQNEEDVDYEEMLSQDVGAEMEVLLYPNPKGVLDLQQEFNDSYDTTSDTLTAYGSYFSESDSTMTTLSSESDDDPMPLQAHGLDANDNHFVRQTVPNSYEFMNSLSSGAYGAVYSAVRKPDNQLVAIKVIKMGIGNANSVSMKNESMN